MNILQCGYGVIGKKLYPEFMHMAETTNGEIVIYDPPLQKGSEMTDLNAGLKSIMTLPLYAYRLNQRKTESAMCLFF